MSVSNAYTFQELAFWDYYPGTQIGIASVIGTIWWIITWFTFVKTTEDDKTLRINGVDKVPLTWFWYFIDDGAYGWVAASYFSYFWGYLLVSFLELIAYILFMVDLTDMMNYLLGNWFFYCFIIYVFPWLFAILHIVLPVANGGLASPTQPRTEFLSNDWFLMIMGLLMWAYQSIVHIAFSQRLLDHIEGQTTDCKCAPYVPAGLESGEKEREYRVALAVQDCKRKCPLKKDVRETIESVARALTVPKVEEVAEAAAAVEPQVDDEELLQMKSEKTEAEDRPAAQNFSESEAEEDAQNETW